jgi:hypothetical protein
MTNQPWTALELRAALAFWATWHTQGARNRVRLALRDYRAAREG